MPNPTTAAEWAKEIPRTCLHEPMHGQDNTVRVCYACLRKGLDAYARQQVEAVLERARNTVEECGAVGDHDDDYYHGYDQAIQDAAAAIRALTT